MQQSDGAASGPMRRSGRRRRMLLAALALALLGHLAFLGGLDAVTLGPGHAPNGIAVRVRAIEAAAAPAAAAPVATAEAPAEAVPPAPAPPLPAARARQRVARAAREPSAPTPMAAASAPVEPGGAAEPVRVAEAEPMPTPPSPPTAVAAEAEAAAAASAAAAAAMAAASSPAAAAAPLLAEGQQPPPVYRTRLPAPATLRYQVRSGFLRGTGEIRWRREGDAYQLALEARIAGLALLKWSSEGAVDAAGLAPVRFLDQRARRAPQAANFQRPAEPGAAGKVSFSGPATEWPLYAGTQDELSWMIQLAGIAAAEPGLLVDGGVISLVVVGARGEARVWKVRYAGLETVETAAGPVHAAKLVREREGPYDRSYEIWLDPERGYLPAHVTRRGADGNADFDILLDRVEPAP